MRGGTRVRDLKADLDKFNSLMFREHAALLAIDILPEAIERAITAEELLASHSPEGHNVTNQQYIELRGKNEQLSGQLAKMWAVLDAANELDRWTMILSPGKCSADAPIYKLREALAELEGGRE